MQRNNEAIHLRHECAKEPRPVAGALRVELYTRVLGGVCCRLSLKWLRLPVVFDADRAGRGVADGFLGAGGINCFAENRD